MKRSKKAIIGALAVFAVLVVLGITGTPQRIYAANVADYPDSWLMIEPGMKSQEAWDLLGEPYADGRGLKTLDRWQIYKGGVELNLDLWFEDEGSSPEATITRVVMWKNFLGVDAAKKVTPPWP